MRGVWVPLTATGMLLVLVAVVLRQPSSPPEDAPPAFPEASPQSPPLPPTEVPAEPAEGSRATRVERAPLVPATASSRREASFALHGAVVDGSGSPVPRARVAGAVLARVAAALPRAATTADGDGRFLLALPEAEGSSLPPIEVRLAVTAEGFAPTLVVGLRVFPDRTTEVGSVALLRPASLEGRVLDSFDRPLEGAAVTAIPTDAGTLPAADPLRGALSLDTTTGADGSFRLEGVSPGVASITVSRAGFVEERISRSCVEGEVVAGLTVHLREGNTAEGLVLDGTDRPVAGAEVRFEENRRGTPWFPQARSDEEGRFRLGPLPLGATGRVTARTAEAVSKAVPAEAGARDLRLRVEPALSAIARVVDARTDAPCAGAKVSLERSANFRGDEPNDPRRSRSVSWDRVSSEPWTAGSDGRLSIPVREEGWYRVEAKAERFVGGRSVPFRVGLGAAPPSVEVRLEPGGRRIPGRVLDSSGLPRAGARVSVSGPGGPSAVPTSQPGDDGAFEADGLAPGRYRVAAWARNAVLASRSLVVQETVDPEPLEIRLARAGLVRGRVTAGGAPPRTPCLVVVGGSFAGFVDPEGRFEIGSVAPGDHAVRVAFPPPQTTSWLRRDERTVRRHASTSGSEPPLAEVSVAEGETVEIEIDASAHLPRRVYGFVRRAGSPAEGARVLVRKTSGPGEWAPARTTTDREGAYELGFPASGEARIEVYDAGGSLASATRALALEPGGEVEVSFVLLPAEVTGRIASEDGRPIEGAQVALSHGTDGGPRQTSTHRAGADGAFAFGGLPRGSYLLSLTAKGFARASLAVDLESAETRDLGSVVLRRAVNLLLEIRDAGGIPIPSGRVVVEDAASAGDPSRPRDVLQVSKGRLEISDLAPGAYRLRLLGPLRGARDVRLVGPGPQRIVWTLGEEDVPSGGE